MDACVTENTLAGFLEGRLSREVSTRLQEHIARCPACRALMVALASAASLPMSQTAASQPRADGAEASKGGPVVHAGNDASAFTPPQQLDEYRILGFLGQGSMGQVYLGRDTRLDRLVAIKFLVSEYSDERYHGRILTEARAIARIQHPNVVTVYRVGEHAGRLYLVSEFVRGQSLDRIAKPLPWSHALAIGIALTRGLSAAHRQGVLHRDIKPANAILTADGNVKLLDFGLAKLAESQTSHPEELFVEIASVPAMDPRRDSPAETEHSRKSLTRSDALVGTPRYMAPELWKGEAATAQSDLYSLGALLYELCSGVAPHHTAKQLTELRERVQLDDPAPLHKLVAAPALPLDFSTVVMRCLRRSPDERIASANELLTALVTTQNRLSARRLRSRLGLALGLALVGTVGAMSPFVLRRTRGTATTHCSEAVPCAIDQQCLRGRGVCVPAPRGWRELPAMKVPRGYACAAYVSDAVFVFGGVMEADPKVGFTPPNNAVEKFDFSTLRWSSVTPMPTATLASRCVTLNGRIYVLGGRVVDGVASSGHSNYVQVFDPASNSWSAVARMQRSRAWFGAAVLHGRIYAIGGVGPLTPDLKTGYLDSVEVYEPARDVWTLLDTKLAVHRYMLGVTAQADRIYAAGGQNYRPPADQGPSVPYKLIEEFDERQGTFRVRGDLPSPIETMELFPLSAESLLLTDTRHLFRLALHDGTMSKLASLPQDVASHDTALVLTPHGLFAAGGGSWGKNTGAAHLYRF